MNGRVVLLAVLVLVLRVLLGGTVSAEDDKFSRETLAGLPGVAVIIEEVKPPLQKSTIQTDVELRLRRAGIRVLSEEERLQTTGFPYLYVNVNHMGDNIAAKGVSVELRQSARLVREPHVLVPSASTWAVGSVGTVGKESLVDGVRKDVRNIVDIFINAYLSVNPNIKPGAEPDDDAPVKPKKKKKKPAPEPSPAEQ